MAVVAMNVLKRILWTRLCSYSDLLLMDLIQVGLSVTGSLKPNPLRPSQGGACPARTHAKWSLHFIHNLCLVWPLFCYLRSKGKSRPKKSTILPRRYGRRSSFSYSSKHSHRFSYLSPKNVLESLPNFFPSSVRLWFDLVASLIFFDFDLVASLIFLLGINYLAVSANSGYGHSTTGFQQCLFRWHSSDEGLPPCPGRGTRGEGDAALGAGRAGRATPWERDARGGRRHWRGTPGEGEARGAGRPGRRCPGKVTNFAPSCLLIWL